jgi:hypothetical protein
MGLMLNPNVGSGPMDSEMIPLCENLQAVGIKTLSSCAGHAKPRGLREPHRAQLCIALTDDMKVLISNKTLSIEWKRHPEDKD